MPRRAIKVYVPKELEPFILTLERKLGVGKSEIFLIAFMDYLKGLGLIKE